MQQRPNPRPRPAPVVDLALVRPPHGVEDCPICQRARGARDSAGDWVGAGIVVLLVVVFLIGCFVAGANT